MDGTPEPDAVRGAAAEAARVAEERRRSEEALRMGALQAEVHDDFERVRAAGSAVEGCTGIRFDGGDVVVLLTDPDRHGPALRALVEHPDRLRVERAPYSRQELDAVWRELRAIVDPHDDGGAHRWHSMAPGFERVSIGLNAAEHALAARLHERFGDLLEIRLGALPYPLETERPPRRIELPEATLHAPDLELIPEPDQPSYRPGETIHGALRVVNHGARRVLLDAYGWATGRVIDDSGAVVGGFVGARAGVEHPPLSIGPGLSRTVPFVVGTSSTDPRLGAALPPGDYRLVVSVEAKLGKPDDGPRGLLVSSAVPLAIRD